MPRAHLTDITIRNLTIPEHGQEDHWDATLPSFGIRCSQGGSRTFILLKNKRRIVIGRYPIISLQQARTEARRRLAEFTLGHVKPCSMPFDEAVELYLSTNFADAKKTTAYEARRLLSVVFLPVFRKKALEVITTQDIIAVLDPILTSGRPSAARHAYAQIRAFFRWALSRRYIDASPLQWLKPPAKATKRDRVLSEIELAKVYVAAQSWGFPFGHIVLLLIMTGQRRGEIGSLKWDYIDFQNLTVTLPATATKNKVEHTFPITEETARFLKSLPRLGPYLFPARGSDGPFCGWSRVKASFDKSAGVSDWGLHDLRRTFSTRLALLKVPPHVIERILNHVSGEISGIAAIYNRWSYLPEMREAMFKYEQEVVRICSLERT